jgi:adenine-specific DNA-methyltransferase
MNKPRLELTWIGKYDEPRLEPRILLQESEKSYGDSHTQNLLIHGDNLLALKALEQEYAGKLKCIYIDPPYNTGSAFEHYDDGIEHSIWLSLMRDRLKLLRTLLSEDGSIWVSIDDNEGHYLKVMMDEIFGRNNFVASNVWQKRYSRENREAIGDVHEYIFVYGKNAQIFKTVRNKIPMNPIQLKIYKNPNNDPKGPWRVTPLTAQTGHATKNQFYSITLPSGNIIDPPAGNCWRVTKNRFDELVNEGKIYFGKNGNSTPGLIRYLSEVEGVIPWTWWSHDEVGHNDEAKKEAMALNVQDIFSTPKPERLIQRILHIATNPGDLVLDSFLGSGTTAAVAHKMGRRWIGIELGDHCDTHCLPRLKKVVDGTDQGGISKAVDWKGGGGFKYFRLAPSLLKKDDHGHYIINELYNADMLAAAVCKHEGFRYDPDPQVYWKHGRSTEKDYIFVTTMMVTPELIDYITAQMAPGESLLICSKTYRTGSEKHNRAVQVKKIPNMLYGRCEFGKEDYSLNIISAPVTDTDISDDDESADSQEEMTVKKSTKKKSSADREKLSIQLSEESQMALGFEVKTGKGRKKKD